MFQGKDLLFQAIPIQLVMVYPYEFPITCRNKKSSPTARGALLKLTTWPLYNRFLVEPKNMSQHSQTEENSPEVPHVGTNVAPKHQAILKPSS